MKAPAFFAAVTFCAASLSAQSVVQSDDFSSAALDPIWTVIDPVGDVTVDLVGFGTEDAQLRVQIPGSVPHDLFTNSNDAPRVLQSAPNADFSVAAKFDSDPMAQFQFQGILVQESMDNLLRCEFLSRGGDVLFLFVGSLNNNNFTVFYDEPVDPDSRFVRVDRVGDDFAVSTSIDGVNFTTGVNFNYPLAVSQVGVHVGTQGISAPSPEFTSLVDYFFNTAAPIDPEDGVSNNEAPIADAGSNVAAHPGDVIVLDGSASSDDLTSVGDLTKQWSFISVPAGSSVVLSGADTINPSFTVDALGDYVLELIVIDEGGLQSPPATVTVSSVNQAPVADAGSDDVVSVGELAILDGLGSSDADGDMLSYQWTLLDAPAGSAVMLADDMTANATFTPDLTGNYTIQLVVDDGFEASAASIVEITAIDGMVSAEQKLRDLAADLRCEPFSSFRRWYHKFIIRAQIRIAAYQLECGYDDAARCRLQRLLRRVDGVALRGQVDGRRCGFRTDWIVDADLQLEVYNEIQCAIDLID
ncbi:MAG: PKD domain-containing protein [Planctomycetota bacterium]